MKPRVNQVTWIELCRLVEVGRHGLRGRALAGKRQQGACQQTEQTLGDEDAHQNDDQRDDLPARLLSDDTIDEPLNDRKLGRITQHREDLRCEQPHEEPG